MVNYKYDLDTYYKRIPQKDAHQKLLNNMSQKAKIIAAPHFPYEENTIIVQLETEGENDGKEDIQEFVDKDPYVKNNLVTDYTIREFNLRGASTDFDRLS